MANMYSIQINHTIELGPGLPTLQCNIAVFTFGQRSALATGLCFLALSLFWYDGMWDLEMESTSIDRGINNEKLSPKYFDVE